MVPLDFRLPSFGRVGRLSGRPTRSLSCSSLSEEELDGPSESRFEVGCVVAEGVGSAMEGIGWLSGESVLDLEDIAILAVSLV